MINDIDRYLDQMDEEYLNQQQEEFEELLDLAQISENCYKAMSDEEKEMIEKIVEEFKNNLEGFKSKHNIHEVYDEDDLPF